jgi:hypothetical protein
MSNSVLPVIIKSDETRLRLINQEIFLLQPVVVTFFTFLSKYLQTSVAASSIADNALKGILYQCFASVEIKTVEYIKWFQI